MLRYLTAGESHGKALVVIVEGLPAGLPITIEEVQGELARRRLGYGRGPRMRFEADEVTLLGGIRHGRTLGSPVAIEIGNSEWPKWTEEMSPAPGATEKPLTQPRPGHADLAGHAEVRVQRRPRRARTGERARDRGAGCGRMLRQGVAGDDRHVGAQPRDRDGSGQGAEQLGPPCPGDLERIDESPVRCFDPEAEAAMIAEVKAAAKAGDSLGGVVEVLGTACL